MSEGASDRLRRLIDRLPAMVGYWDSDLRNVVANEAHVRYFGLTPDEIRGRNIFDLLGEDLGGAQPALHRGGDGGAGAGVRESPDRR